MKFDISYTIHGDENSSSLTGILPSYYLHRSVLVLSCWFQIRALNMILLNLYIWIPLMCMFWKGKKPSKSSQTEWHSMINTNTNSYTNIKNIISTHIIATILDAIPSQYWKHCQIIHIKKRHDILKQSTVNSLITYYITYIHIMCLKLHNLLLR
jgi:hypothetical protein